MELFFAKEKDIIIDLCFLFGPEEVTCRAPPFFSFSILTVRNLANTIY